MRTGNLLTLYQVREFSHGFKKNQSNLHITKEKFLKVCRKVSHTRFSPNPKAQDLSFSLSILSNALTFYKTFYKTHLLFYKNFL